MVQRRPLDIGLTDQQRSDIARGLSRLLADSYTLYLMTHNFHWNVTGPNFTGLHAMFETQYDELAEAVDDIAERIRALGEFAPQGYRSFGNLSSIGDGDPEKSAEEMLRELQRDHETVVATARAALPAAQQAGDEVTVSLLSDRLTAHEKHAWMLRSTLGGK